jgi:C-terminal processing protease CtpA/Prc
MRARTSIFSVLLVVVALGCSDLVVNGPEANRNAEDFETIFQLVRYRYAFLTYKHINWDSLVTAYRPSAIAAAGDEIYPVLHRLLGELKDGHVELRTEGGFPVITYKPPRFQDGKQYSPLVVRRYFKTELRLAGQNNMEYEILPGNIGYVAISTFTEGNWAYEIDNVLEYFKNTKGLIIDIRNNNGGNGSTVDVIVGRFIAANLSYALYSPNGNILKTYSITPRGPLRYQQRVVVLINGMSFSAAEMFPIFMKQVSTVTTLGDTTGGGGGSNDVFPLPSGKRLRMPTSYFTQFNGAMVEWNGVAPDILVPQTEDDIRKGNDLQLEGAISELQ